ncbi:MAG: ABC transporter ATP-binding protein [Alphaproteobacteria bacterium]
MTAPLLDIAGLNVAYGGAPALTDVTLSLQPGEIVALLGPNGAGKSSLLRAIIGLVPAKSRHVTFDGIDLSSLPAQRRARIGIAYVPEGRRVFPGMTVEENLKVACRTSAYDALLTQSFRIFPQLVEHRRRTAWRLSGGQQQMLAIARALVAQPRLILLDEPSLGLAPGVADQVFAALGEISRQGAAILLAEQSVSHALGAATRGYILQRGRIVAQGDAATLNSRMTIA